MITFTITFHTPFHVATGTASEGLARLVDSENPLPASTLKGRMRAAAATTLGLPPTVVAEVFGSVGDPSPWWWSDAHFGSFKIGNTTRIRVDDATGTTARGFLMMGQHVWADTATFTVAQRVIVDRDISRHAVVLRASARAITTIGGQRRRGEGWVTITDGAWTSADTDELAHLRSLA